MWIALAIGRAHPSPGERLQELDDQRPLGRIALAVDHGGAGMRGLGVLQPRIERLLGPGPAAGRERLGIFEIGEAAGGPTVDAVEVRALAVRPLPCPSVWQVPQLFRNCWRAASRSSAAADADHSNRRRQRQRTGNELRSHHLRLTLVPTRGSLRPICRRGWYMATTGVPPGAPRDTRRNPASPQRGASLRLRRGRGPRRRRSGMRSARAT